MKILDAKVSGEFLDLLAELNHFGIVALRTVLRDFEVHHRDGWPITGKVTFDIMATAEIPDDWWSRVTLPVPRRSG